MKYLGPPQSGSLAGQTASHNRAGQYYRNRRSPVQPIGTGRRSFIRAAFGAASIGWASLTAPEQAAWTSFAAGHPITDSLGQSVVLTGQQMFVRCQTSATNVGAGPISDPPASTAVPDVTAATFTFSVATGISVDGFTGAADDHVAVAFSRPVSPGVSFMKTFWQPLGTDGYNAADDAPLDLTTAIYAAEFGAPVAGQAVFCRITPVNQYGFNGTPKIVRAIVTA